MRLVIMEGSELIADVPDYRGPVPRQGEYIHHPRGQQPQPGLFPDGVMSVKSVSWGITARPGEELRAGGCDHFVGAAEPFIEVSV